MWPELVLVALALLVAGQGVVLWQMRAEMKRLRVLCEASAQTDVPTSMLVAVLSRVQRTLETKPVAPAQERPRVREVVAASSSYDVARRLVSEGAGADQLVEHCGLSRGEAELLRSLHAAREGVGMSRT